MVAQAERALCFWNVFAYRTWKSGALLSTLRDILYGVLASFGRCAQSSTYFLTMIFLEQARLAS